MGKKLHVVSAKLQGQSARIECESIEPSELMPEFLKLGAVSGINDPDLPNFRATSIEIPKSDIEYILAGELLDIDEVTELARKGAQGANISASDGSVPISKEQLSQTLF